MSWVGSSCFSLYCLFGLNRQALSCINKEIVLQSESQGRAGAVFSDSDGLRHVPVRPHSVSSSVHTHVDTHMCTHTWTHTGTHMWAHTHTMDTHMRTHTQPSWLPRLDSGSKLKQIPWSYLEMWSVHWPALRSLLLTVQGSQPHQQVPIRILFHEASGGVSISLNPLFPEDEQSGSFEGRPNLCVCLSCVLDESQDIRLAGAAFRKRNRQKCPHGHRVSEISWRWEFTAFVIQWPLSSQAQLLSTLVPGRAACPPNWTINVVQAVKDDPIVPDAYMWSLCLDLTS